MPAANPSDAEAAGASSAGWQDLLQTGLSRSSLAANLQMTKLEKIKTRIDNCPLSVTHDPNTLARMLGIMRVIVTEMQRIEKKLKQSTSK